MAPNIDHILHELSEMFDEEFNLVGDPLNGHSNLIQAVSSSSGRKFSVRISHDDFAARLAQQGYKTLRQLKQERPELKAPRVIAANQSYGVLDFLEGEPIGLWNHKSLSDNVRKGYLDGLSCFYLTIWTTDLPDSTISYEDWLRKEVDYAFLRALRSTDGSWGDPMSFLFRRSIIQSLTCSPEDSFMVVRHGDMNAWNVIVNGLHLTGVIDWDYARIVPAGSAVQHPLFIADIPGWANDGVDDGETFHDDRAYLENAIAALGKQSPYADSMRRLLETSHQRQFFELSLRNKRVNVEYSKRAPPFPDHTRELQTALSSFLEDHEHMKDDCNIGKLRERLWTS